MAGIDYGCIVFKNGKKYKGESLYPTIDELGGITFYKCTMEYPRNENEDGKYWFGYGDNKKVYKFTHNNINFTVKEICERVYKCEVNHNGDKFFVVFGYGIDNDKEVWDEIKEIYLGKKNSRKVDIVLNKFEDWK